MRIQNEGQTVLFESNEFITFLDTYTAGDPYPSGDSLSIFFVLTENNKWHFQKYVIQRLPNCLHTSLLRINFLEVLVLSSTFSPLSYYQLR